MTTVSPVPTHPLSPGRANAAPAALFVLRLGLGALLLWSGIAKIQRPHDLLSSVYGYELTGPATGLLVAMTLPWVELVLAIGLLGGLCVGGAMAGTVLLGAVFVFVNASALARGLTIGCGCFGEAAEAKVGWQTLARAGGVLVAAAGGWWLSIQAKAASPQD